MGEEEQLHLEWRKGVTDNLADLSDDNKKISQELTDLSLKFERSTFTIEALIRELKEYRKGVADRFDRIESRQDRDDIRIDKLEIFKIKLVVAFTIIQGMGLFILNYFSK